MSKKCRLQILIGKLHMLHRTIICLMKLLVKISDREMEATDEQIIEVTKKSGCYEFIMQLENGFDTVVGGAGGHLSGGERQRISIARAMLKDAPIVILDEATAYTDPENEAILQNSIA